MSDLIKILLVEDNPADVRLAQETLKDYKLQNSLYVVTDGEAALTFLRQRGEFAEMPRPDMVLLDLALPKLDGLEVLARMRQDPDLKNIPVVILTASTIDPRLLELHGVSADCYILKPMTLERYLDAVRCLPQIGLSIVRIATA